MATADERVSLESLDGDPGVYRKWMRRAQLRLAALPNTMPKQKLGPRLMLRIKKRSRVGVRVLLVESYVARVETRPSLSCGTTNIVPGLRTCCTWP